MSDKAPKTQVIDERIKWRSVWFPGPGIAGLAFGSVVACHVVSSFITGEELDLLDTGIFDGNPDNVGELLSAAEFGLLAVIAYGFYHLMTRPQIDTKEQRVLVEQPPAPQPPQVVRRQS